MTVTWLAGPQEANDQAWIKYLQAVSNDLVRSWEGAKSAYLTLKQVRESLGLPLMSPPEAGPQGSPGAWSTQLDRTLIDTQAFVTFLKQWASEAVSGDRKIGYDPSRGLYLALKDSDQEKLVEENGTVTLVDPKTNQPIDITGTVGVAPAVAWAAAAGTAVVTVGTYFTVKTICETVETYAEQKTMSTISDHWAARVAAGQATPEEAQKVTEAIYNGAKELTEAKGAIVEKKEESSLGKTITTVGYVALGVAGIFLLAKVLPPIIEARA